MPDDLTEMLRNDKEGDVAIIVSPTYQNIIQFQISVSKSFTMNVSQGIQDIKSPV